MTEERLLHQANLIFFIVIIVTKFLIFIFVVILFKFIHMNVCHTKLLSSLSLELSEIQTNQVKQINEVSSSSSTAIITIIIPSRKSATSQPNMNLRPHNVTYLSSTVIIFIPAAKSNDHNNIQPGYFFKQHDYHSYHHHHSHNQDINIMMKKT